MSTTLADTLPLLRGSIAVALRTARASHAESRPDLPGDADLCERLSLIRLRLEEAAILAERLPPGPPQ